MEEYGLATPQNVMEGDIYIPSSRLSAAVVDEVGTRFLKLRQIGSRRGSAESSEGMEFLSQYDLTFGKFYRRGDDGKLSLVLRTPTEKQMIRAAIAVGIESPKGN